MERLIAEYYPDDGHAYVNMLDCPYPKHINAESFDEPDVRRRVYVPERTAHIVQVPRKSHVAIGHYECGECGKTIDVGDKYCRHCGSKLEGGWK